LGQKKHNRHFSSVEREVFDVSTKMVVGDGETALFWVDKWLDGTAIRDIAPDLFALIPKRARKRRTVREALVQRRWITDIQGATSSLALWQYVQLWIVCGMCSYYRCRISCYGDGLRMRNILPSLATLPLSRGNHIKIMET
jgi:hypothetical protein